SAGTLRNLGAAVRRHPIVFMLLSAGFAGLMLSYALFVTVSVRLMLDPAPVHAVARSPLPARVVPAASRPPHGGVAVPGPAVPAPARLPAPGRAAGKGSQVSRRGWVLFGLMSVIWGVPYLLIKVADGGVSVPVLVFARVAIGSAVLLPLAIRRGQLRVLAGR